MDFSIQAVFGLDQHQSDSRQTCWTFAVSRTSILAICAHDFVMQGSGTPYLGMDSATEVSTCRLVHQVTNPSHFLTLGCSGRIHSLARFSLLITSWFVNVLSCSITNTFLFILLVFTHPQTFGCLDLIILFCLVAFFRSLDYLTFVLFPFITNSLDLRGLIRPFSYHPPNDHHGDNSHSLLTSTRRGGWRDFSLALSSALRNPR